jgi:hypothetical protein
MPGTRSKTPEKRPGKIESDNPKDKTGARLLR